MKSNSFHSFIIIFIQMSWVCVRNHWWQSFMRQNTEKKSDLGAMQKENKWQSISTRRQKKMQKQNAETLRSFTLDVPNELLMMQWWLWRSTFTVNVCETLLPHQVFRFRARSRQLVINHKKQRQGATEY